MKDREQKIFPEMGTNVGKGYRKGSIAMEVWTTLRIEHEGKWYLQDFQHFSSCDTELVAEINRPKLHEMMAHTVKSVWYASQCGKVELDLLIFDKVCPWVLDEDQRSEEQRVKEILEL